MRAVFALAFAIAFGGNAAHADGTQLALQGIAAWERQEDTCLARTSLDGAVIVLRNEKLPLAAALVLTITAELDRSEGRLSSAMERLDRAEELLNSTSATALHDHEMVAYVPKRFRAALIGMEQRRLNHVPDFLVRNGRIETLIDAGRLDDANAQLRHLQITAASLDEAFTSAALESAGDLRRNQWQFEEAAKNYVGALDTAALPAVRADLARKIADLEMLSGNADEALRWNAKAEQSLGTEREPLLRMEIGLQRATVLFDRGNEVAANAIYAALRESAGAAANLEQRAAILIGIASARMYRGDYGEAIQGFYDVIELLQQLHRPDEEMYAWAVLTLVYTVLGSDESAEVALENGRRLAERSSLPFARELMRATERAGDYIFRGLSPLDMVVAFSDLLQEPAIRGLTSPADQLALTAAAGGDNGDITVPARGASRLLEAVEGLRLMDRGQFREGRQVLVHALETTTNLDFRAFYLSMIGGSFIMEMNIDQAIRYYAEAVDAVELAAREVRGEEMLADFFGGGRQADYGILVNLLLYQRCNDDALWYTERSRSRTFLQMIGSRRINPRHESIASEMEQLRSRMREWKRQGILGRPAQRQIAHGNLRQARARYRELIVRAKTASPEYAQIVTVAPLDVARMHQAVPPDTNVISYFVSGDRVVAWVIDRERTEFARLKAGKERLQRIACWAKRVRTGANVPRSMAPVDAECADETTAEDVYEFLIAPLRAKLRKTRLIIIPHGVLHYVPFAALRDPQTQRYLLQDYVITHAPSVSTLPFLRKERPAGRKALVIGSPTLPEGRRLSGARTEAQQTAARFGTIAKTDAAATEALLYNLRGQYGLIHIGAHGEYDAEDPLFSRIVLAGDATHDGSLEVHEILADVDLTGVALVVLSACGSGRGEPSLGDEVVGMTRAVHYAGSRAVIATLWDIDDDATAALMNVFYRELDAGKSASEALRAAQLALLGRAPYRDPAYWAAFVFSGDPHVRWRNS